MWDVGGQKSLRSYWRNYFECTDGLIWVVDSADKRRLEDCRLELQTLLQEERLAGCTLLVFANKQDLPGALTSKEIKDVSKTQNTAFTHYKLFSLQLRLKNVNFTTHKTNLFSNRETPEMITFASCPRRALVSEKNLFIHEL